MKTKELIEKLQFVDPTGELECCVDNVDIYFVDVLPAYYDGALQLLVHDESKKPYYSIVGGKVTTRGYKVKLVTVSIEDMLLDNPDAPVDLSECSPAHQKDWEARLVKIREEVKQVNKEVEEWMQEQVKARKK